MYHNKFKCACVFFSIPGNFFYFIYFISPLFFFVIIIEVDRYCIIVDAVSYNINSPVFKISPYSAHAVYFFWQLYAEFIFCYIVEYKISLTILCVSGTTYIYVLSKYVLTKKKRPKYYRRVWRKFFLLLLPLGG